MRSDCFIGAWSVSIDDPADCIDMRCLALLPNVWPAGSSCELPMSVHPLKRGRSYLQYHDKLKAAVASGKLQGLAAKLDRARAAARVNATMSMQRKNANATQSQTAMA